MSVAREEERRLITNHDNENKEIKDEFSLPWLVLSLNRGPQRSMRKTNDKLSDMGAREIEEEDH